MGAGRGAVVVGAVGGGGGVVGVGLAERVGGGAVNAGGGVGAVDPAHCVSVLDRTGQISWN